MLRGFAQNGRDVVLRMAAMATAKLDIRQSKTVHRISKLAHTFRRRNPVQRGQVFATCRGGSGVDIAIHAYYFARLQS